MTDEEFARRACDWVRREQREFTDSLVGRRAETTVAMMRSNLRQFVRYLDGKHKYE